MVDRTLRLERRARLGGEYGPEFTVSAELPVNATLLDVSAAAVELQRVAPIVESLSACCGVLYGFVHHPDCKDAPDDLIERLREEAVRG